MRCRSETIESVVRVVVSTGAINHLRDIVDGVELVLKVSERVWRLCVGQAGEALKAIIR